MIKLCGLYGYIGKPDIKTKYALHILGLLNEERGNDSSGIATIYKDKFYLLKDSVNSEKFWKSKNIKNIVELTKSDNGLIFLGHTRQATRGSVSQKNSHPFRIANFVFAHNGSISNFDELQTKYKTDYEVDSQIIGYSLAVNGVEKTFNEVISGWYTVPFIDLDNPKILNVARSGAPMALGLSKNGIYYSSDIKHLQWLNEALDMKLNLQETRDDTLYSFNTDTRAISKKTITPVKTNYQTTIYNRAWDSDWDSDYNEADWYDKYLLSRRKFFSRY